MTARTVSMGAPFRWLMKAVDVGRRNPKALFGGFALFMLVVLVPSVVQVVAQTLLVGSPTLMWTVYGLVIVVGMVITPPITGAVMQLLHRCEMGQPASATDVFGGYRDTAFAVRMIKVSLLLTLVYVAVWGVMYLLLPGKEYLVEFMMRAMTAPPGGQPDLTGMPEFDSSIIPMLLLWFVGMMTAMFVMTHAYLLALNHAAVGGHGPVAALLAGFGGFFRNLLPLAGFTIVVFVVAFVLMMVAAVVLGMLMAVLMLLSPVLATLILLPVYLVVMLLVYVVMFGFYYHAWREIFGEVAADPMDAIAA